MIQLIAHDPLLQLAALLGFVANVGGLAVLIGVRRSMRPKRH
jgi:hypothetical protein